MRYLLSAVKLRFFKLNLLIFIFLSLAFTFICEKIPAKVYYYRKWLFRERKWEHSGRIYESIFKVKSWKTKLPDISDFMKWRFNKKHLADKTNSYLSVFLTESCKAEFTHWMIIVSTVAFNFWNDFVTSFVMFILACLLNLPYIIIQRYNRPRLLRLLQRNDLNQYELSAVKV